MHDDFVIGKHWLVQPSRNRISNAGKSVRLPSKYMHVLVCLAERAGESISREYLMETVWKDTVVVEESLTRAISELRKIFADDTKHSQYIETIPKIGYRLLAPVLRLNKIPTVDSPRGEQPAFIAASSSNGNNLATNRKGAKKLSLYLMGMIAALLAVVSAFHFLKKNEAAPAIRTYPLTSYQGIESQPALSPDGQRLAFVWNGGDGQMDGVYVKAVGSDQSTRLTDNGGSAVEPAWSPDGRHLAFVRHSTEGCTIFKIASTGGAMQKLLEITRDAHPFDPAWSPDGRRLAYTLLRNSQRSIYLLSLETLTSQPLGVPQTEGTQDHKPLFSPDGKKLIFLRTAFGKTDIYQIAVDGGAAGRLTQGNHRITDFDWTPDGRAVVLASQEGLWKARASDGHEEFLTAGSSLDQISIARQSWRLAYTQLSEDKNIWQFPLASNGQSHVQPTQLIGSSRADAQPHISPDGKWIAFVSDRSGQPQIWKSDWAVLNVTPLTNFAGCRVASPSWSPDGRLIAFVANPEGQLDLYVVAATGGEAERLTATATSEESPVWSRDGRWIYFGAHEEGCRQISKMAMLDRRIVSVLSPKAHRAMESGDGKWLYFSIIKNDTTEFWRKPVTEGDAELVLDMSNGICENWKVSDKGIYFGYYDARCHLVFGFFDFASRQISPLFSTGKSSFAFDVTADGRTLVFDQFDRSESDIMLMENFR